MSEGMKKIVFQTVLLVSVLQPAFARQVTHNGFRLWEEANSLDVRYGRGVSLVDFNADGRLDMFIASDAGLTRVFENLGDMRFRDVTFELGLNLGGRGMLGVWADYDNDRRLDLFTASTAVCRMFRQMEQGYFDERTAALNISGQARVTAALWADVDLDGFVDLYLARFDSSNVFYRSQEGKKFIDVIGYTGANDPYTKAMGGAFADIDNDGDPDLYLVHDNFEPARLYINDGTGTFRQRAEAAGVDYRSHSMGAVFGDFDNDGFLDLYTSNIDTNYIFFNNQDGTFSNTTEFSGVGNRGMAWSTSLLDFDNDGLLDIYVANTSSFAPKSDNKLFRNLGGRRFEDVTEQAGVSSWEDGYGCATGDLNNDGFMDIVLTNDQDSDALEIYINNGGEGNYLQFELQGTRSNGAAIGARVSVFAGGTLQIREVSGGSGWLSQDSPVLHFGLGSSTQADSVVFRWPSGLHEVLYDVRANQRMRIVEGNILSVNAPQQGGPEAFRLAHLSPNPFRPGQHGEIVLQFNSVPPPQTDIIVYDILGRPVRELHRSGSSAAGRVLHWDGRNDRGELMPTGLYFIQIRTAASSRVTKMALIR